MTEENEKNNPTTKKQKAAVNLFYTSRFAWCPLVSHGEYADGTDRQTDGSRTPDRYITLSAKYSQRTK